MIGSDALGEAAACVERLLDAGLRIRVLHVEPGHLDRLADQLYWPGGPFPSHRAYREHCRKQARLGQAYLLGFPLRLKEPRS